MILQTPCHPRRLDAANAPRLRRSGRVSAWALSLAFAGLLGTAVWRLDNDGPRAPDGPLATAGFFERTGSVARELLETLVERAPQHAGIDAPQSPPEGWPLWVGDLPHRPPSSACPDGTPVSASPMGCE